ncbi:MAG TPA: CpaF family protein, partial [Polyangiaceae bacterium]|nr:CpaF family protein [Polyangiaceae bacterium]
GDELLRGTQLKVQLGTAMLAGQSWIRIDKNAGIDAAKTLAVDRPSTPAPAVGAHTPRPGDPALAVITPRTPGRAQPSDAAAQALELRREMHRDLLQHLDLGREDISAMDASTLRPRVIKALRLILARIADRLPEGADENALIGELADEALGLGPLESLLADPEVSEIMVVDPHTIFVERRGRCVRTPLRFTDDARVRAVIERIVTPLGRRIDESTPLVDARLPDGSRVNAIIKPLALRGACITIRKFPKDRLHLQDLVRFGSLTEPMARFLERSVAAKKNIVVAGGTGSGKTTLLNCLSSAIPEQERIVTIEDSAELQLAQPHVVSLETRPPNVESKGQYTIRDLVKNALRMRPDRIVVGECRGGEALDMLQAMNTGHEGSLTTVHANTVPETLRRLETLCLMAGLDLPAQAIRENIASSVHLVVQQTRLGDGTRKVTAISQVAGMNRKGRIEIQDIYGFAQTGTAEDGSVLGRFAATGYLPSFLDEFIVRGLIRPGEPFL